MIEPYDKRSRETRNGTQYEIWKWICPECNQEKSTLYIDGEICHGDGQVWSGKDDKWRCFDCWGKEL